MAVRKPQSINMAYQMPCTGMPRTRTNRCASPIRKIHMAAIATHMVKTAFPIARKYQANMKAVGQITMASEWETTRAAVRSAASPESW